MYGLIGEKLGHSFSKEIHEKLSAHEYALQELAPTEVDGFFRAKNFKAVNVTIPYKQTVIPYLDDVDPVAKEIGAVNTVVNEEGKLFGYNTDFFGLKSLISRIGVPLRGKKVAILGTGGTSKTAYAVCKAEGAGEIVKVGRTEKDGAVDYQTLYARHADIEYLINTTPVGMYPNTEGVPVDLEKLPALCGVADVVYNPLRTLLVLRAQERKIPALGGLYMLVAQAVKASELFHKTSYPEAVTEQIYGELLRKKRNIVLVGMPSSGKTTVSKLLGKELGRAVIDTDEEIVKSANCSIPELFEREGEEKFREREALAIEKLTFETGAIVATGGGVILKKENVENLKKNGLIFFLDRPLSLLTATADRPLSRDEADMKKRYEERYEKYLAAADLVIRADKSLQEEVNEIVGEFNK